MGNMLDNILKLVDNHHEYAREWKARTGGKILGTFCTYVPEEIIYGADVLPVRIMGSLDPQDVSEAHIASMYCPFCRDCLAQGLQGRYEYLDGVMIAKSCMHMLQAFRSWILHVPVGYNYFLGVPALMGVSHARDFLGSEIEGFKASLEEWLGRTISTDDLDRGIDIVNTNRRLLRALYELRKADPPLISGAEAATLVAASQITDKREINPMLAQLLQDLPQRRDGPVSGPRIMMIGSENHDLELLKLIESRGASIVIEEQCTGSRYFWNEVIPEDDRIAAIAQRYISRPRCPLKDVNERQRLDHVMDLAREFNVQGALLIHQKFCAPHEFDLPHIDKLLKEEGIPTYALELDVTMHKGSVATRTEAFLEMLELDLV